MGEGDSVPDFTNDDSYRRATDFVVPDDNLTARGTGKFIWEAMIFRVDIHFLANFFYTIFKKGMCRSCFFISFWLLFKNTFGWWAPLTLTKCKKVGSALFYEHKMSSEIFFQLPVSDLLAKQQGQYGPIRLKHIPTYRLVGTKFWGKLI